MARDGHWRSWSPAVNAMTAPCWPRCSMRSWCHDSAGRARTRPEAVIADRAYTSGVTRRLLRRRKITAVIPQKCDETAARQRRGSAGGRPPAFNETLYKSAISSSDHSPCSNNGEPWPPAMTSLPSPTAPLPSSAPASPGPAIWETCPSGSVGRHRSGRSGAGVLRPGPHRDGAAGADDGVRAFMVGLGDADPDPRRGGSVCCRAPLRLAGWLPAPLP